MTFIIVLSVLASIVLTVVLAIKVLPAKRDGTFTKKLPQTIHDYFNFKTLYLESILKVIFTFFTVACIVVGLLAGTIGNILQFISNIARAIEYDAFKYMGDMIWTSLFTNFLGGIALAVLGPIALRLAYEGVMMFILLVKNVIDINSKLKKN